MADDIMKEDIVVVTSPDDTVEAFTKERKNLPAIRFVYHPMASNVHARYLDDIRRGGESIARHQEVNYKMLAKQVIDGDLFDSKKEKLNFSSTDAWKKVLPEVVFDIASTIAGLDDLVSENELSRHSDL